jgi:hypothetical protein
MHAAKHFQYTGFGIKPILDLYIMFKYRHPDKEAIKQILKKYSLLKFGTLIINASNSWFNGGVNTSETDLLANFIADSKNYESPGKANLDTIMALSGTNTGKPDKCRFYLSQIFVNKYVIYNLYPFCRSHKYFLPLFYIIRIFSKLFSRKSIDKSKKILNSLTDENLTMYKKIQNITGLSITDNRFKE